MTREEILRLAEECVCTDRQTDYGSPEYSFVNIAILWTAYIDAIGGNVRLDSKDVANMMILLKIARGLTGPGKDDNWIDIAGYAACGGEIESRERADKNRMS